MEEDRGNFKNKKFWHFMYCTNNQNFLLSKIRIRLRLLLSTSHKSTCKKGKIKNWKVANHQREFLIFYHFSVFAHSKSCRHFFTEMISRATAVARLDDVAELADAIEAVARPLLHKPMDGTINLRLHEWMQGSTLL